MTTPHAGHQTVQSFYETFPYPAVGWVPFDHHRRAMINYHASRCCHAPLERGCRILVAGCGTMEALTWALSFPESQVVAIDLSAPSVELTRQRAAQLGLANVKAQVMDILDAGALPGGPFELISSYGVLHHMADPSAGLAVLRGLLAPGGLMHLMVYNTANRYWLQVFQSLVDDLCADPADVRERFEVAKRLVTDLAQRGDNLLQAYAQDALKTLAKGEPEFMDAYAHPREQSYTIAELHAWLARGGLHFTGWVNPWKWNTRRLIGDPELLARLERMPPERRDHLMDQTRRPLFEFYAEPAATPPHPRPCDLEDELFWQRVPQLLAFGGHEIEKGQLTGRSGVMRARRELAGTAEDPTARVWVDEDYDFRGHPIMLGILDAVDGRRTMRELAEAACAAEGIPFADVSGALAQMFRGFLDEAHCIDIDPEQCHACRNRCLR